MTQIIELPPGSLLPKAAPPLRSNPVEEPGNRSGVLAALCLGILAGLLVLVLLIGIARQRAGTAHLSGAASRREHNQ